MPSAPYYRHDDPTGSALNNVAAEPAAYDELINKPRVFTYKPSYGSSSYGQQGITHPAPVYYANQPQPQAPMGYYVNQAVSLELSWLRSLLFTLPHIAFTSLLLLLHVFLLSSESILLFASPSRLFSIP